MNGDPAYFTSFMKESQCACSKLLQIVIALDVNVTYVQPYSRTTYANDVKFSKLAAGTTSILNIGYAPYSRGNFTPKKA